MSNHSRFIPRRPVLPCSQIFQQTPRSQPSYFGQLTSVRLANAVLRIMRYDQAVEAMNSTSVITSGLLIQHLHGSLGMDSVHSSARFIDQCLLPGDLFALSGRGAGGIIRKIVDHEQCRCDHKTAATVHTIPEQGHFCVSCGLILRPDSYARLINLSRTLCNHQFGYSSAERIYKCSVAGCNARLSSMEMMMLMGRSANEATAEVRSINKCNNHFYELTADNKAYRCNSCRHTMSRDAFSRSMPIPREPVGPLEAEIDERWETWNEQRLHDLAEQYKHKLAASLVTIPDDVNLTLAAAVDGAAVGVKTNTVKVRPLTTGRDLDL